MQQLNDCETFSEIQIVCSELPSGSLDGYYRYIIGDSLLVCEASIDLYPDDVPHDTQFFSVEVRANGDCLPACGSVFVHGKDTCPDEIRLNIIKELVSHKDLYLNEECLSRGLECQPKNILKSFAMYSDEYEHGAVLANRVIENIFEQEIMQVRKPKTFMGIWQMFALSSVMRRPIFSVYPKRGNPVVRKDLHRRIEPREKISNNPLYIMWTTTRYDMTNTYWAPNHFAPVLQIQEQTSSGHVETINADEWQESETHTNEKFDEPAVRLKDDETVEGIQDTCNNYDDPENR